ncbi:MAG: hypothetical protein HY394_02845 [Candidatus Diapherotrites archaeon]|nr:hypothetical protein [Candidatus Diapherotrites archaeon]
MPVETLFKRRALSEKDAIFYSFDFDTEAKELVRFCAIQLLEMRGKTHEVIKFDAAHGKCHVHRYCKFAEHKETIGMKISPETLKICRKDIAENWQKYKGWYLKKRPETSL